MTFEERRVSPERIAIDTSIDRKLRGRAITFNALSKVVSHPRIGPFRERILPEAVDRTLSGGADIKALWNHDTNKVLGSRRAGTLSLTKTIHGLQIEIDPPKWAAGYVETVERGDVDGMSFQFFVPSEDGEEWDFRSLDGLPLRSVRDMVFREISITPFPAYDHTSVEVSQRSIDTFLHIRPDQPYDWRSKYHQIMGE